MPENNESILTEIKKIKDQFNDLKGVLIDLLNSEEDFKSKKKRKGFLEGLRNQLYRMHDLR